MRRKIKDGIIYDKRTEDVAPVKPKISSRFGTVRAAIKTEEYTIIVRTACLTNRQISSAKGDNITDMKNATNTWVSFVIATLKRDARLCLKGIIHNGELQIIAMPNPLFTSLA